MIRLLVEDGGPFYDVFGVFFCLCLGLLDVLEEKVEKNQKGGGGGGRFFQPISMP